MAHLGTYELADHHFPDRIQRHRLEFPDVDLLEHIAVELAQAGFPAPASLRFVRQVCRWGGYYGIAARVRNANQPEAISAAFQNAFELIGNGDLVGALVAVNALDGLGRPSFASKFIRFLAPQLAAILDQVIHRHTGFPLSADGYGQLIQACQHIATQLAEAGVVNPVRSDGRWYIADIEAAFYADMENLNA
jgi:hypothetical protein